jgi:lysophospholipase L1-like esterase
MSITSLKRYIFILIAGLLLNNCAATTPIKTLSGFVFNEKPLAYAEVIIKSANGQQKITTTDQHGYYSLSIAGMNAPLLLSTIEAGTNKNCIANESYRAICMTSALTYLSAAKNTVNINPLTDRIVSDVAIKLHYIGPQQLFDAGDASKITPELITQALKWQRASFKDALSQLHEKDIDRFDPIAYPQNKNHTALNKLLPLLHFNRNYDNNTSQVGHTTLSDISFRPLAGLNPQGDYEIFNYMRALTEQRAIKNAALRIFIVGDSTSAVYEALRFPREGWAQALEQKFKPNAHVKVIVGSRAGRSSRDFFNGRWFSQMEPMIQRGDYVFINHGHNDQNCNSSRPLRGTADVSSLCTYPNDSAGGLQFPEGKPMLSFQNSLTRYIDIARSKGAIPILLTPTARILNANRQQKMPVVHSHYTQQNENNGYLFVGDYSQTIMQTAAQQKIPLLELEAATIELANALGDREWKNYWLAIDPTINHFYDNNIQGSWQNPDGTHLQAKGGNAIADLVAALIKKNELLTLLAEKLK